jgi:hypothetical protein
MTRPFWTAHEVFGTRLTRFVTCDNTLFDAAIALGLPAEAPGQLG